MMWNELCMRIWNLAMLETVYHCCIGLLGLGPLSSWVTSVIQAGQASLVLLRAVVVLQTEQAELQNCGICIGERFWGGDQQEQKDGSAEIALGCFQELSVPCRPTGEGVYFCDCH
jgi:hypothetical protein